MRKTVADDGTVLTPTQALILEVLAARARLGERTWPFAAMLLPALTRLRETGLIGVEADVPLGVYRVSLTDAGNAVALREGYDPPAWQASEWGTRLWDGSVARCVDREDAARAADAGEAMVCRFVAHGGWRDVPAEYVHELLSSQSRH